MKKKTIVTASIITAFVATIAVVIAIARKRGYKRFQLADYAKDYLQIYHIDKSANKPLLIPYRYQTGADAVKANPEKTVTAIAEGEITGEVEVVPIRRVIYNSGRSVSYNGNTDYIFKSDIIS